MEWIVNVKKIIVSTLTEMFANSFHLIRSPTVRRVYKIGFIIIYNWKIKCGHTQILLSNLGTFYLVKSTRK